MSGFASRALEQQTAPALAPRRAGCARRRAASAARRDRLSGEPRQQRAGQPELPEPHRPRPRRAAARRRTRRRSRSDPNNPTHIVASLQRLPARRRQLLRRRTASTAARTWTDSTPPMGFTRGDAFGGVARQYWQAGGDTSVAWDTKGNAYLSCQMFNRGAAVVAQPRPVERVLRLPLDRQRRRVVELPGAPGRRAQRRRRRRRRRCSTSSCMTVDDHQGQPVPGPHLRDLDDVRRRRHRATSTRRYSRDYGEHFSAPVLVSTRQRAVRQRPRRPDAAGPLQREPVLAAVHRARRRALRRVGQLQPPACGPARATTRAAATTGATPHRRASTTAPGAARQVDRRRQHVLGAGQGRRLLRPARLRDLPGRPGPGPRLRARRRARPPTRSSGPPTTRRARSTRRTRQVVVTFGSYINRHSNETNGCVPQGFNPDTFQPLYDGVKTPGACNNDIVISRSTNGGTDVHRRARPTCARCRPTRAADAAAPTSSGSGPRSTRAAAWPCPTTTAPTATTRRPGSRTSACPGSRNGSDFATTRVTSASMPPPTAVRRATFFGDYSGLSAGRRRASVLDGHARSRPVRVSRLGRQRDAAAERLHGGRADRRRSPTTRTSTPGAHDPAALSGPPKREGRADTALPPYHEVVRPSS